MGRKSWRWPSGGLLAWLVPDPTALGAAAWVWGAYIGGAPVTVGEPELCGPSAGHPECLAADVPPSAVERDLWERMGVLSTRGD
ncbi:DUF6059 family protein [Streptomyces rectiviolaceus]|uniref:Secreted protein n=1 Tax=Streptomyces rectiviolaceus TaxID=332591 RepID=A0ABP6MPX8_9ACTN